jgi:hypothetical protein
MPKNTLGTSSDCPCKGFDKRTAVSDLEISICIIDIVNFRSCVALFRGKMLCMCILCFNQIKPFKPNCTACVKMLCIASRYFQHRSWNKSFFYGTVSQDIAFYFRVSKFKSVLSIRPLMVFLLIYFIVIYILKLLL